MPTFAVQYTYAGDPGAMDAVRPEHKDFLGDLHDQGILKVSGPIASEDGGGALLVLEGRSHDDVAAALDRDPFARHGFIAERTVRQWNVFFGGFTRN